MSSTKRDFSIFKKFDFERAPIAVKYFHVKPDGIERIGTKLNICEMLPEAQKGKPFYAIEEDITCVGPIFLGMRGEPVFEGGFVGPKLGMYEEKRANEKLYGVIARLPKGITKYVAFSTLDKLSFDPDVLIVTANVDQADVFLRATTYSTGAIWHGRTSNGVGCNWVYVYPYISGELNFTVSGLGFGYFGLPEGLIIISIPYNLIPTMLANLKEIEWRPIYKRISVPELKKTVEKIHEETLADLGKKVS